MYERCPGDERMVVAVVIEDRDAHAERRREAVHRREPVLALAEVRHDLEAPRRFAQADDEDALAVAIDEIESPAAAPAIAAVGDGGRMDGPRADRPARLAQQDVERLPRALTVEDVAGPQRELVAEPAHERLVDPLELDAVDDALVDRHRQHAGGGVELRVDPANV